MTSPTLNHSGMPGGLSSYSYAIASTDLLDDLLGETAELPADRLDVFVHPCAAFLERHAERVELLAQPTDAHAQLDAPLREHVERRELLGEDDGVALRQDEDAGREAERRGGGADPCQPDQRIGDRALLGTGHATARRVRVLRLVVGWDDDVLDGPERLDAVLLGDSTEGGSHVGLHVGTDVGEHDPELHRTPARSLAGSLEPMCQALLHEDRCAGSDRTGGWWACGPARQPGVRGDRGIAGYGARRRGRSQSPRPVGR